MRPQTLFALLAIAGCFSCTRNKPIPPTPPAPVAELRYTASHPPSITIYQYHDTVISLPVTIRQTSGPQQNVNVQLTSYPAFIQPTSASWSALPDTFNEFWLTCNTNTAGDHPITITTSSGNTPQQTSVCNIRIVPTNDCVFKLFGKYTNISNGKQFEVSSGSNTSQIVIRDLIWPYYTTPPKIDTFSFQCDTKKISKSVRISSNEEYVAYGSCSGDTISLKLTLKDEDGTSWNEYTLVKKK